MSFGGADQVQKKIKRENSRSKVESGVIEDLLTLAGSHRWVPTAAVLIWLLLRLAKKDPKLAQRKRWFPWVSLGMGVAAGIVARVSLHEPNVAAFVGGLFAGCLPIVGHEAFVEAVSAGKETPIWALPADRSKYLNGKGSDKN